MAVVSPEEAMMLPCMHRLTERFNIKLSECLCNAQAATKLSFPTTTLVTSLILASSWTWASWRDSPVTSPPDKACTVPTQQRMRSAADFLADTFASPVYNAW